MLDRKWRLIVLAPLLASPAWAHSGQSSQNPAITVEAGHETVSQWSQRVGRNLDDKLAYPQTFGRAEQGLAKIQFQCSEDGRPGNVTVLSSSGSNLLDHAAMNAVKGISTLHPLPDGIAPNRSFQAWIAFAQDSDSLRQMLSQTHRQAAQMNARIEKERLSGHQFASNSVPIVIAAN